MQKMDKQLKIIKQYAIKQFKVTKSYVERN
jgi:hypothetical protein